ncbi:MAG: orotidine-5'-phosphate decarboxylase [Methylophilaceae bacterium]|tara:strand:- start:309 stop:1004 length:696 start_codon:yes stop_codon:yes gene_type:complete
MAYNPKLFIAIDHSEEKIAKDLIQRLPPEACGIKIGKELFTACGPKIVDWVHSKGFKVFLDLKYHDIPNTVEKACFAAAKMNISILNIHALGGKDMMLSAREGVDKSENKPYLIAVTILTSMDENTMKTIGLKSPIKEQIKNLALSASQAKLDGIVCSAKDILNIKKILPKDFLYVTPGIRPKNEADNDQKRIVTPSDAIKFGSSILVVGRPVTKAKHPELIVSQIIKEIS